MTGSIIQAALETGVDISYRPSISTPLQNYLYAWCDGGSSVSPDGTSYAAVENKVLVVRDCRTNALLRSIDWGAATGVEPRSPGNPMWSRDGATLVLRNTGAAEYSSTGGVWSLPANLSKRPVQIVVNKAKGLTSYMYRCSSWSPDSGQLLIDYVMESGTVDPGSWVNDVMRVGATGGTPVNLTGNTTAWASGRRWVSNRIAP
jgi:hypothetical protein